MDGGDNPPSIDRLCTLVPSKIVTGINDGHNTAAAAFGEKKRNDYRAGQRLIIEEMVQVLRDQHFVDGPDTALRWLMPLNGEWQVAMGDRQFTIRGQLERRLDNERDVLGERDEEGGHGKSGRLAQFDVEVFTTQTGSKTKFMSFAVHDLALIFPPLSQFERGLLRESIAKDGVKNQLEIFEGKVIDGRNRLFFASTLKKPIHIKEFKGTYEEAKRHVTALNLARRHLNRMQIGMVAVNMFLDETRMEAAANHGGDRKSGDAIKMEDSPSWSKGPIHERIIAKAAAIGLQTSEVFVRAAIMASDTEYTKSAIESGKIDTAIAAVHSARDEKNKGPLAQHSGRDAENIRNRLGAFIDFLKEVITGEATVKKPGKKGRPKNGDHESISQRLDQIEGMLPAARRALRDQRIMK
jgi:hypothetical protein